MDALLELAAEPSAVRDYVDADGRTHELAMRATAVTQMPRVCIFDLGSREEHLDVHLPLEWRGRRLQSLVVHEGADGRGHYLAAGRAEGGGWWVKSDAEVHSVSPGSVIALPACIAVYCGERGG